jgi:hypothetical protein
MNLPGLQGVSCKRCVKPILELTNKLNDDIMGSKGEKLWIKEQ